MTAFDDAKASGERKHLLRAVGRAILESLIGILTLPVLACRRQSDYDNEIHFEDTEFNRGVVDSCPSLKRFKPAPWAPGPHSQTIWGALVKTKDVYTYEREMVTMADRVRVALDWCLPKDDCSSSQPDDAPIVLCLHGIACSSEGKSLKLMMEECIHRNWRGVVYNRRGHAGTSLLPEEYEEEEHFAKPFPVHADVEDMTAVIEHITKKYPRGRIVCVGFSLGSNLMVRYLGNSKSGCGAVAGVSVANGFDMVEGTKRLQSKGDWDAIITMKMKRLLVRHSEDLVKTRRMAPEHVKEIVKSKSFREFDAIVMGHLYGYEDVDEYYRENSCVHLLHDIEVPLLCLGDQDDPLLTQELLRSSLDAGKVNRHIITALTRNGGHLGWIEGWTGRPWMSRVIGEYIHAVLARDPAASTPSPFSAAAAAVPQPTLAPIESVPSETPSTATAHLSLVDIDVDTSHHSDAPSPDDGTASSVVEMDGVVAHPTLDGLSSTDGEGEGVESRTTTEGIASSNVEVEEQSPSLDSTGRVDTLPAVKVGGSEAVELYATATAVEAVPQDSAMVGM